MHVPHHFMMPYAYSYTNDINLYHDLTLYAVLLPPVDLATWLLDSTIETLLGDSRAHLRQLHAPSRSQ